MVYGTPEDGWLLNLRNMEELNSFLKENFESALKQTRFYLFGRKTPYYVSITAGTLIFGAGPHFPLGNPSVNYGAPIQSEEYVDILKELSFPIQEQVNIYGPDGKAIKKATISLKEVLKSRSSPTFD